MPKTLFGCETREVKPYNKRKGMIKPVLQIKDGVVINRFESICEAGRRTNIIASSISDVCRGKNKSTGGYVWKYAEYDLPIQKKDKKIKVTAIKKQKKGPFKVIITELCNSEEDAKALLGGLACGTIKINPQNARIIQTRNKK